MTDLIETRPAADHGQPFEEMAARVRKNADEGFAGAFVVVSPDGENIQQLFLNNSQHPAMFWAALKSVAEIKINEIDMNEQRASRGGW